MCVEHVEYGERLILFMLCFTNSIFMCCVVARLIGEMFETENKNGNKEMGITEYTMEKN